MISRLLIFLLINFAGLGLGGLFTPSGVQSEWYAELSKAPWTPPGWVFGSAWTTIMICFALYMAYLWPEVENKKLLIGLFSIQWILNFIWNPIFFHFHMTVFGLLTITALTILVTYLFITYFPVLKIKSYLLLPYVLWLFIATSLNAYIVFQN